MLHIFAFKRNARKRLSKSAQNQKRANKNTMAPTTTNTAPAAASGHSYRRARTLYEAHADLPSSLVQYETLAREGGGVGVGGGSAAAEGGGEGSEGREGRESRAVAGYNAQILRALLTAASSTASVTAIAGGGELPPYQPPLDGEEPTTLVNSLEHLTALHNAALAAYAASDIPRAVRLLLPALKAAGDGSGDIGSSVGGSGSEHDEAERLAVLLDLSFLAVDCALSLGRGDALGIGPVGANVTVDDILQLIEGCMSRLTKLGGGGGGGSSGGGGEEGIGNEDELNFRMSVYKSRILLAKQSSNNNANADKMTRMARKELKGAMETYNHKLVPRAADGGGGGGKDGHSVAAGSVGSGGDASGGPLDTSTHGLDDVDAVGAASTTSGVGGAAATIPHVQRRLEAQNQYALSLKAHLECLKDNGKKAVKLTAEARHAGERRRVRPGTGGASASDDAIGGAAPLTGENADAIAIDDAHHLNNLALLHQTEGKNHAALHYYSRALNSLEGISSPSSTSTTGTGGSTTTLSFESDGTALPNPLPSILHNAAICAFAVRNYVTSYECMARAVRLDPATYGSRARCYLRMAEACLGVHEDCKANRRLEGQRLFEEMGRLPLGGGVAASTVVRDLAFRDASAGGSGSNPDPQPHAQQPQQQPPSPSAQPPALEIVDVDDVCAANVAFALHDTERMGVGQRSDPRLTTTLLYRPTPLTDEAALESELGSAADLQQTSAHPVPRAFFCLRRAMDICLGQVQNHGVADHECMESILLLLTYLHLEVGEPAQALEYCRSVLDGTLRFPEEHYRTEAPSLTSKRRVATAKLYECEALCLLQQAEEGMQALTDDKTDARVLAKMGVEAPASGAKDQSAKKDVLTSLEELDSLTKDLAYLLPPSETPGEEGKSGDETTDDHVAAQFRLEAAKSIVHAVAAAAAASSDQPSLGNAHALCALRTTLSQTTGARKTLLYCLLKEGKVHQALELLQGAGRRVGVQP